MIAVIFEVKPHSNKRDEYLDIAASLKPMLKQVDGFISIERFQSLSDENKLLSLSFFRDEESIKQWRSLQSHRDAQTTARDSIFENYRLRIAGVIRDYGMYEREQAPVDSKQLHDPLPHKK